MCARTALTLVGLHEAGGVIPDFLTND